MSNYSNLNDMTVKKRLKLYTSTDDSTSDRSNMDMTETGNKNDVLLNQNNSLSPEELVFSIEHILEIVFTKCDRQTLLNSRLVSRRWAYYGSKELQKTVSIVFFKSSTASVEQGCFEFISYGSRSMVDLISLMNISTEFPCTSFEFRISSVSFTDPTPGPTAQPFYNAHGASIKKITFLGGVYMEEFKQLLLNQAPNLQELHLWPIRLIYKNSTTYSKTSGTLEQQSEQERHQKSLFYQSTSKPRPILKNLKVLKCDVGLSSNLHSIFIQQLLESSPNLVEVVLPPHCLRFLIEPSNRVHLLRTLDIDLNNFSIESFEYFANQLVQENINLAIFELHFYIADADVVQRLRDKVANIMKNILRASSATCQKLVWNKGVDNLQIPQMPQVKHLTIQYFSDKVTHLPANSLGEGVSLSDTFPNLKSLEIIAWIETENLPIENIFSEGDPIPAVNVKTVIVRLLGCPGQQLLQRVKEMFPNASVLSDFDNA